MIARILLGTPGDWSHRHPRLMLGAVIVLVLLAQWLVDLALPEVVQP